MHNIKDLRKNLDSFKKKIESRNIEFNIDEFNKLDELNRKLISEKEKLEQEKKLLSKSKDKSNFSKSKKISDQIELVYNSFEKGLDTKSILNELKSNLSS